ncbi:hypothetical protein BYT27DRAFT_7259038 [Phlegmacium glaucopus]|nr:hypothetical protein BYT27DRAFT_7259038 [Phlegmacium glaucopus]
MPAAPQINNDGIEALDGNEPRDIEAEVPYKDEDEEPAVEIVADTGEEHLQRLFPEDDNIQVDSIPEPQASSVPPEKSAQEQVEDLLQEMREAKHRQKSIPRDTNRQVTEWPFTQKLPSIVLCLCAAKHRKPK